MHKVRCNLATWNVQVRAASGNWNAVIAVDKMLSILLQLWWHGNNLKAGHNICITSAYTSVEITQHYALVPLPVSPPQAMHQCVEWITVQSS
jgi:hypothetical protein